VQLSIASQEQDVALVFGTEMSGLSNRELDLCQLLAMIPTNADFSSLNVAAAVQVMCYELRMSTGENVVNNSTSKLPLATSDEVEGFYQHLEETLIKVGFLNPKEPKKLMQRVRRIYSRASLEKKKSTFCVVY
jgi:tRNA/rRNA methyltransferase